jgi:hypothetical protein
LKFRSFASSQVTFLSWIFVRKLDALAPPFFIATMSAIAILCYGEALEFGLSAVPSNRELRVAVLLARVLSNQRNPSAQWNDHDRARLKGSNAGGAGGENFRAFSRPV